MSAFLALLKRYWPHILLVAFIAYQAATIATLRVNLTNEKAARESCQLRRQLDQQNVKAAAETARADAETAARKTETRNAAIAQEKQRELEDQLAAARGAAARYARLHRQADRADQGGSGQTDMPGIANPAVGSDGPASGYLVSVPASDLDACAVNATVARGWQDWWQSITTESTDE